MIYKDKEWDVLPAHEAIEDKDAINRLAFYLLKPKPQTLEDFSMEWLENWVDQGETQLSRMAKDPQVFSELEWLVKQVVLSSSEWTSRQEDSKKLDLAKIAEGFKEAVGGLFENKDPREP